MDQPQRKHNERHGHMLMVLPTNLEVRDGKIILDGDFSYYLRLYADAFERVVIACPAGWPGSFPTQVPLESVQHDGNVKIIVLPEPYREDRYLFSYPQVKRLLKEEIKQADFVVVAPHSPFDWSTLAAELCIEAGKPYNMEGDWNLQQVSWSNWKKLPFGINKARRYYWMKRHDPRYFRAMRSSNVALLHGQDVFEAYKDIAPKPIMVNNICVTPDDRISNVALQAKMEAVLHKETLNIVYAGRAIEMKGPIEWLSTLRRLDELGVKYQAAYFGDGHMLPQMQDFVDAHDMADRVRIAGRVERSDVFSALMDADIFMFCHLTRESPRNVVEALAAGAPIVGFGSSFYENLVEQHGGGLFVATGDTEALAQKVANLNADRQALASLIGAAALSGQRYDRDTAIKRRIELMKQYCLPPLISAD